MPERLPMADMEDRRIYRIHSRNLVVGAWRASSKGFVGIREKFGDLYLFEEYHTENGAPYGTAVAFEALDFVPEGVQISEFVEDAEGEFVRDEKGHLQYNEALFEILKPLDEEIHRQRAEEWKQEQQERESKRWAPNTLEDHQREERIEAFKQWWDDQGPGKWQDKELKAEFFRRSKEAYG